MKSYFRLKVTNFSFPKDRKLPPYIVMDMTMYMVPMTQY